MAPMPELHVRGTCFALTGRMWTERRHIEQAIIRQGGSVAGFRAGCVLVIASNKLHRGADNKWHVTGKASHKVEAAIAAGAPVYHEKILQDALANNGVSGATMLRNVTDPTRTPKQQAKQARERNPEWNDEMQARLDANLREMSELLASF